MPTTVPMPTKAVGDIFTTTLWNNNLRDNLNKLLNTGHRVLTVAQFAALGAPEGTKGTVAPDEVYLEVDSTNGLQWHLAYESGEPTYKWRYIGGPPMVATVGTDETTASTTYVDITTVGPFIAIPRAGDFDCDMQAQLWGPTTSNADVIGPGVTPNDAFAPQSSVSAVQTVRAEKRVTFNASGTAKLQYRAGTASTIHASQRRLAVKPVRLI